MEAKFRGWCEQVFANRCIYNLGVQMRILLGDDCKSAHALQDSKASPVETAGQLPDLLAAIWQSPTDQLLVRLCAISAACCSRTQDFSSLMQWCLAGCSSNGPCSRLHVCTSGDVLDCLPDWVLTLHTCDLGIHCDWAEQQPQSMCLVDAS